MHIKNLIFYQYFSSILRMHFLLVLLSRLSVLCSLFSILLYFFFVIIIMHIFVSRSHGFKTPLPIILPSFNLDNASVAWLSLNLSDITGLIISLSANDINSVISAKVPV